MNAYLVIVILSSFDCSRSRTSIFHLSPARPSENPPPPHKKEQQQQHYAAFMEYITVRGDVYARALHNV